MRKLSARNKILRINKDSIVSIGLTLLLLTLTLYPLFAPSKAQAAVTQAFVRFDRLATGTTPITGSACLETTTVGAETNVVVVFPSDWTISTTPTNWTVNNTNLPYDPTDQSTQATYWPGIGTATSVDGLSVIFPGSDLTPGTFYCFNFTGASSTIGPAGNNKTGQLKTQGGTPYVDSVDWATSVVAASADQITVTASVSALMTFSLSGNSVSLGNISAGTTTAGSAITQHVSTNARNGWISWVKSGTDGGAGVGALHSTVANADIDSPGSWNLAPETLTSAGGYVLDVNDLSCNSCFIAAEYNATGGSEADQGGHLDYSQFRQTAYQIAPANDETVDLVVKARSSNTTPAASDYTDTLTVVAAGSF